MTRAQAALAGAQKESEQLRAELGLTTDPGEDDTIRVYNARCKLRAAYAELTEARNNIHGMRVEGGEIGERVGLGRGIGALIPVGPIPSSPPPVDEDVWAEMLRQHDEDEYRHGRG